MPAYVISDVTVRDAEAFEVIAPVPPPRSPCTAVVIWFAAGSVEPLEAEWAPRTIVIVEFPDMERARV